MELKKTFPLTSTIQLYNSSLFSTLFTIRGPRGPVLHQRVEYQHSGMNSHTCLFLSWSSLTDLGRMEGWVGLGGWLHTEI